MPRRLTDLANSLANCVSVVYPGISIVCVISFFLLFSPVYSAQTEGRIKALDIEGLTRIEHSEFIDLISVRVGERLDRSKLKQGIRRAFKKGIFLDIQAETEGDDEGIRLKYIVKEIPVIHKIIVKGNRIFSAKKIKSELTISEGDLFLEDLLKKAEQDLMSFYERKGYANAVLTFRIERSSTLPKVTIHLQVEPGLPQIIKEIHVVDEVRKYLTVYQGGIFDRDLLNSSLSKVRERFKKRNYLNPVIGDYSYREGVLIIPVILGPELDISFTGNAVIGSRQLRKSLPFMEREEVSDETVSEAVEMVKKFYRSKGYYYVQVAAAIEQSDDIIKATFFINEGEMVMLRNIAFEHAVISHDALKAILPLKKDRPYDENLLEPSRESLKGFYTALGYRDMNIQDIRKDFQSDGSILNLVFVIDEGLQTRIDRIEVRGNNDISSSEIENALHLPVESPYNTVDIRDARYRVLSLYSSKGYVDVKVDVERVIVSDRATLTFRITENRPYVIGKIIFRGNNKTKSKILWREFTVAESDPLNFQELQKVRQRLYRLGIFNEVSIEPLQSESVRDGRQVKDLLVTVKESKAGSVELGIGYGDYEKLRGSFDIRYSNLGGYDRELGFKAEVSDVEQRYVFNFTEPWLFNKPDIPLTVSLLKEDTRAVNIDTNKVSYEIDRFSIIVDVAKELARGLKANLSYEYAFVDTTDVDPDVILSREDTGTLAIGSISPSLFYDTRDNPFDPSKGSIHGIVIKYASEAFLSETDFIKGTFQSSWFIPLFDNIVGAVSLRGGVAYSYSGDKELPIIERFFLGGRTTVRGYSHDALGPKGENNNPTGGNVFALVNGELRIALKKGFGLVTFIDAGNVWQLIDDFNEELKYTAGAGLRYRTPVGPLRIDYGYKLDREQDESRGEVHFSFGHAF